MDHWIASVFDRLSQSDFDYGKSCPATEAYKEAYGDEAPFPPVLEKKALEAAMTEHPDRDDLQYAARHVELLLEEQWPLYRWRRHAASVEPAGLAMDGVEASFLSLATRKDRFEHAVAAFCRYLTAGSRNGFRWRWSSKPSATRRKRWIQVIRPCSRSGPAPANYPPECTEATRRAAQRR